MLSWDPDLGLVGAETTQEKLARWQNQYRSGDYLIDPNFTVVPQAGETSLTPEQALVGLLAEETVSAEGTLSLLYDQTAKPTAEGRGLDAVLSLVDVIRRKPTPTTVQVQVVGTALFPLNNQTVLNESTQQLFRFPSTYSIPAVGSGSVTLTSDNTGPIIVASGDAGWSVIPAVAAITSITATQDSVLGAGEESDSAFLARSVQELGAVSVATEPAILASVSSVIGVTSTNGEFNRDSTVSPTGVPGWHAELVVEGGSDLDIANAIDTKMHATMATFGNVAITASSGRLIKFTRPTIEDVEMEFSIINIGSDVLLDTDTRNAIFSAIAAAAVDRVNNTLGVGDDIAPVTFGDLVTDEMPAQSINSFLITARIPPAVFTPGLIGITKRQRPRLLIGNVSGGIA